MRKTWGHKKVKKVKIDIDKWIKLEGGLIGMWFKYFDTLYNAWILRGHWGLEGWSWANC